MMISTDKYVICVNRSSSVNMLVTTACQVGKIDRFFGGSDERCWNYQPHPAEVFLRWASVVPTCWIPGAAYVGYCVGTATWLWSSAGIVKLPCWLLGPFASQWLQISADPRTAVAREEQLGMLMIFYPPFHINIEKYAPRMKCTKGSKRNNPLSTKSHPWCATFCSLGPGSPSWHPRHRWMTRHWFCPWGWIEELRMPHALGRFKHLEQGRPLDGLPKTRAPLKIPLLNIVDHQWSSCWLFFPIQIGILRLPLRIVPRMRPAVAGHFWRTCQRRPPQLEATIRREFEENMP